MGRALFLMLFATGLASAQQPPSTDIFVLEFGPGLAAGQVRNATMRSGYDNQPHFLPDGKSFLYTAQVGSQSDIYLIDVRSGKRTQITRTPENEYSAHLRQGGKSFAVIRVESDGKQRLWEFDMDGSNPRLLFEDLEPVGYQAWSGPDTAALFILGDPPTLQLGALNGSSQTVASSIGRCIHTMPGGKKISFVDRRDPDRPMITELDPATGRTQPIVPVLKESRDYTWTSTGILVMGRGSRIYKRNPSQDTGWELLVDLFDFKIQGISRLSLSNDGRYLAVVAQGIP